MFEGQTNIFSQVFRRAAPALLALLVPGPGVHPAGVDSEAGVRWLGVSTPAQVAPGAAFMVRVRVRNTGDEVWETSGPRRAVIEALVVDGAGNPRATAEPGRWAYPVPPLGSAVAGVRVVAPRLPGRYTLLLGVARHGPAGRSLEPGPIARLEFEVAPPVRLPRGS